MTQDIAVNEIRPNPRQPRKHFVGLAELAASLVANGQLVPVLVRPVAGGYELVHGERRWRAAQLARLATLRADVRELDDTEAYRLTVIENLQREQLLPTEEAEAYKALLSTGLTQAQVGEMIGKTQSYIAHKLRLLDAPEPLRVLVAMGALSESHMRQLLKIEGLLPGGALQTWQEQELPRSTADDLKWIYNELRPEDNPALPLWRHPQELITKCPALPALLASAEALDEYVANHNCQTASWIVAAWWFGAAAVVFDLSVADLSDHIRGWFDRLCSAVLYTAWLHNHGEDYPRRGEPVDHVWLCFMSDMRHAGIAGPVDHAARWMMNNAWTVDSYVLPSAMQPWGTRAEVGQRIIEAEAAHSEW